MEITQEVVREFIDYDPKTGLCVWKPRDRKWFNANSSYVSFNSRFIGTSCGHVSAKDGYTRIAMFGKKLLMHRVIWLWMTGEWPDGQIDHENGNRGDFRFANLRMVSNQQNCLNQGMRKRNKSGYKGVCFDKSRNKWLANICINRVKQYLGRFDTPEEAFAAYVKAAKAAGFTDRHIYGK